MQRAEILTPLFVITPQYVCVCAGKHTGRGCNCVWSWQVIELDPRNSHAYHNRGISYDKMGRFDAAIADFTQGKVERVMHCDAVDVIAVFVLGCSLGAGWNECQRILQSWFNL